MKDLNISLHSNNSVLDIVKHLKSYVLCYRGDHIMENVKKNEPGYRDRPV